MKRVKDAFDERAAALDGLLGVGRSFDMIGRTLRIGGRRARLWVVNGYADDTVLERAISAWPPIPSLEDVGTLQAFADRYVSVCDAAVETDRLKAVTAVFAGKTLLVIDGTFRRRGAVMPSTFPALRGGAGYQQGAAGQLTTASGRAVMKNAALLRRRIRDSQLTLELFTSGPIPHWTPCCCYTGKPGGPGDCWRSCGKSWRPWTWGSIAMSRRAWRRPSPRPSGENPFPKARYTERPDAGGRPRVPGGDVLLLVDNYPRR